MEIAEFVAVIVIAADFSDTQIFSFGESLYVGLICFFVEEIKWSSSEFMGF